MALGYEKKKNYYSFPSVNHTPPPGNVEKKGKSEKREGGREGHMKKVELLLNLFHPRKRIIPPKLLAKGCGAGVSAEHGSHTLTH